MKATTPLKPSFTGLFSVCEYSKAIVFLKFPLISGAYICNSKGKDEFYRQTTGSPSSKYEHRRASALLPYLKCVLRLSCVVHGPIYGRFMGFYMNGFKPLYREKTVYIKTHKTAINLPVDHKGET